MANIRVKFKRVAEAFDNEARARLCESSGSEHSPENSLDLSDLIDSFFDAESREERENSDHDNGEADSLENQTSKQGECDDQEEEDDGSESESRELLRGLLFGSGEVDDDDDRGKERVRAEVERASQVVGDGPGRPGFKRRVMTRLRERGFDAGLCKSKWEQNGRVPSGSYEYIDVNIAGGTRYIVEPSLPGEFTIARPTPKYTSLLQTFPPIFVGKVEELKQIVKLMCKEIRGSMKSVDMHVPPWRRHAYMQAKWFGSYKRPTNEDLSKRGSDSDVESGKKRRVGFAPLPGVSYCCREGSGGKGGVKMGKLALEFIASGVLL